MKVKMVTSEGFYNVAVDTVGEMPSYTVKASTKEEAVEMIRELIKDNPQIYLHTPVIAYKTEIIVRMGINTWKCEKHGEKPIVDSQIKQCDECIQERMERLFVFYYIYCVREYL